MGTQNASLTTGATDLHLHALHANPALPQKKQSAEEEHGNHEAGCGRKARCSMPPEWKAAFK